MPTSRTERMRKFEVKFQELDQLRKDINKSEEV